MRGFITFLQSLTVPRTSRVNCDEMAEDKLRQFVNRNCCRLSHVSWALAQIFCLIKVKQRLSTIALNSISMNLLHWKRQGKLRESHLYWKVVAAVFQTTLYVIWMMTVMLILIMMKSKKTFCACCCPPSGFAVCCHSFFLLKWNRLHLVCYAAVFVLQFDLVDYHLRCDDVFISCCAILHKLSSQNKN